MNKNSTYQYKLERYKYVIVLLALISFILIPVYESIFPVSSSLIVEANFTLVIVAGLSICRNLKNNYYYYIFGILTLINIWLEFSNPDITNIKLIRLTSSLLLFVFLSYILIEQLINDQSFNLNSILGAISGYLFIGLIGGMMFETMQYLNPESFIGMGIDASYTFYYFSFISITSVGYGDVTPASPSSQAITILMNIIGQFYLAVVVAVFVGKFLNTNSKSN